MSGKNNGADNLSDDGMDIDEDEAAGNSDEEGGLRINDDIYIPPPPFKRNQVINNGARLIIKKIVNINFKSYAGEIVIGPFHECFTSIVGPNGSGKSNLIDSMLFVFGYRATKIRSKKISVLIHNSNEHPNVSSCTVAIHFQKVLDTEDGVEIVPNSNFTISRTAFKDSSSYYELSGQKVQFKEIAKLLRSEGVDLDHNRFLILQGEVEQIAMMKPKAQNDHDVGMLEFLEDIIGTARYKEPLNKLTEAIEEISEEVAVKLNRMRISERERDELKDPMQDAVSYLKTENTIMTLQNKLYHCKRSETSVAIEKQESDQQELEADYEKLRDVMGKIHGEKEAVSKELKEKCKKWDSIQQKKDAAAARFDAMQKKDEALHAELVETNKRRKTTMASVKTEQAKLEDLLKVPEKNAKDIEECGALVETSTASKAREEQALETLMGSLQEKTEPLLNDRKKLETKLISRRENVDKAKEAFDMAKCDMNLYTSVEKTEAEKLEGLKQTVEKNIGTLVDRQGDLEQLKQKIPATQTSLEKAQKKLQAMKTRETECTARLQQMRVQYEEQRSAMHSNKTTNRVIDALMREKAAGRQPGVFGRLGDLGAIDAKYDVAISTACGALDHVIVDTVDTAEACLKFLKDNDVGRTTFIPLEKQQRYANAHREPIKTPENVPRLFDLIKDADEQILPAFYFALRDTLVADNLDQASRIAYGAQRWRVVTLKGEVIEPAGTMTGGGRTVIRGKMGQNVRKNDMTPAQLEKLKRELDEIYEECNQLKAQLPAEEEQTRTLAQGLQEMLINREKFTKEAQVLEEQVPSLKRQYKAQKKKAAESVADPARVRELTEDLETARAALTNAEEKARSIENEVARINAKIDEISGNRVKEQQKKISALTKTIDKAKSEICRLEVAIKTAERNVQKTEQRIQTLENDVRDCEHRIAEIQREKAAIEEDAQEMIAEVKNYEEQLTERDEAGAELKKKLDELTNRETKLKGSKIDLDQKLTDCKKVLNELKSKNSEYTRRIRALKLNEIPDEPLGELPELTEEEIAALDTRTLAANLAAAKERLPEEVPNMQIIKEYLQKDAIFLQRSAEVEKVASERDAMRLAYDVAKKRRTEEFTAGFSEITTKLKEMYQMITLGGAAELELVDSLDPFTEGVVFSVRPPKKSWKNISNLSGGEKTLSSLALVFALHHYKPTPLYFMDEIDAALDFKNVSIVGTYIKERTKNAQFIVISHRSEMFELADTLVGIYKTFNATKSATVNISAVRQAHPMIAQLEQKRLERHPVSKRTQCSQASTKALPASGCSQKPASRSSSGARRSCDFGEQQEQGDKSQESDDSVINSSQASSPVSSTSGSSARKSSRLSGRKSSSSSQKSPGNS